MPLHPLRPLHLRSDRRQPRKEDDDVSQTDLSLFGPNDRPNFLATSSPREKRDSYQLLNPKMVTVPLFQAFLPKLPDKRIAKRLRDDDTACGFRAKERMG